MPSDENERLSTIMADSLLAILTGSTNVELLCQAFECTGFETAGELGAGLQNRLRSFLGSHVPRPSERHQDPVTSKTTAVKRVLSECTESVPEKRVPCSNNEIADFDFSDEDDLYSSRSCWSPEQQVSSAHDDFSPEPGSHSTVRTEECFTPPSCSSSSWDCFSPDFQSSYQTHLSQAEFSPEPAYDSLNDQGCFTPTACASPTWECFSPGSPINFISSSQVTNAVGDWSDDDIESGSSSCVYIAPPVVRCFSSSLKIDEDNLDIRSNQPLDGLMAPTLGDFSEDED